MATHQEMDQIVGKALLDSEFRGQLLKDPEKAAEEIGICLTLQQVGRIRKLDADVLDAIAVLFQNATHEERPGHGLSFW